MSYGEVIASDYYDGQLHKIHVTEDLVKQILQLVRASGKADNHFDVNLAEGKMKESELLQILGDSSIEVKRDFKASQTGNIAIEFMCGGNPSGISVTKADWWAYVLDGESYNGETIVLVKKNRLERLLGKKIVRGGDNKKAEMYLIPVHHLVSPLEGES